MSIEIPDLLVLNVDQIISYIFTVKSLCLNKLQNVIATMLIFHVRNGKLFLYFPFDGRRSRGIKAFDFYWKVVCRIFQSRPFAC